MIKDNTRWNLLKLDRSSINAYQILLILLKNVYNISRALLLSVNIKKLYLFMFNNNKVQ